MSCGYYDGSGRPYIDGVVFLPHNDRLKKRLLLPISFLVDTGADVTIIVPSDYEPRGVLYSDFKHHRLSEPGGFGGRIETRLVKSTLLVNADNDQQKQVTVVLEIARPAPVFEESPPPPSVLGRDVIDLFRLAVHRDSGLVHLDSG